MCCRGPTLSTPCAFRWDSKHCRPSVTSTSARAASSVPSMASSSDPEPESSCPCISTIEAPIATRLRQRYHDYVWSCRPHTCGRTAALARPYVVSSPCHPSPPLTVVSCLRTRIAARACSRGRGRRRPIGRVCGAPCMKPLPPPGGSAYSVSSRVPCLPHGLPASRHRLLRLDDRRVFGRDRSLVELHVNLAVVRMRESVSVICHGARLTHSLPCPPEWSKGCSPRRPRSLCVQRRAGGTARLSCRTRSGLRRWLPLPSIAPHALSRAQYATVCPKKKPKEAAPAGAAARCSSKSWRCRQDAS